MGNLGLIDNLIYREDVERVANLPLAWDQLAHSNLVLSGASGMIGSFLVDILMNRNVNHRLDCTIYALARNNSTLVERFQNYRGDPHLILQTADVSTGIGDLPADYVIHAASNTHPLAYATSPITTITTNVQGTYAMLDMAVRVHARRALFLSSVEIYGENCGGLDRFRESDLGYIDCNTLRAGYPESKRTGEALCQAFREQYGLDVVIPRLPRVYGPSMRLADSKALSQFLLRAATGHDIILKSAGDQFFSYSHVADAVSALLICLLSGKDGQAYNVADASGDIHLKDLAHLVAETAGTSVVFDLPDETERRGYSTATRALMDGAKIAELGWSPLYDLPQGIARTIAVLKATIG